MDIILASNCQIIRPLLVLFRLAQYLFDVQAFIININISSLKCRFPFMHTKPKELFPILGFSILKRKIENKAISHFLFADFKMKNKIGSHFLFFIGRLRHTRTQDQHFFEKQKNNFCFNYFLSLFMCLSGVLFSVWSYNNWLLLPKLRCVKHQESTLCSCHNRIQLLHANAAKLPLCSGVFHYTKPVTELTGEEKGEKVVCEISCEMANLISKENKLWHSVYSPIKPNTFEYICKNAVHLTHVTSGKPLLEAVFSVRANNSVAGKHFWKHVNMHHMLARLGGQSAFQRLLNCVASRT